MGGLKPFRVLTKLICGIRGIAGAEARPDLIGFIGMTEVMPCYKAFKMRVFHQPGGHALRMAVLLGGGCVAAGLIRMRGRRWGRGGRP